MKRALAPALTLVAVLALAALAWVGAGRVDDLLSREPALRADWPVVLEIPRGSSATAVARLLERERIVADARVLRIWLQGSGQAQRVQAGEYAFEAPMSVLELGDLLVSGRVVLHKVTVPEGLDLAETAAELAESGLWTTDALAAAFLDPAPVRDLDALATDLEGYLFPDTYHFPRGEPAGSVARAMVARFREAWRDARGDELAAGRSVREVATLASLVEKETSRADEHHLVASVYANRLARGMRLECDPTVITALQKAGAWTGGPLLIRDLSFASPWNTYVTTGLPPGPIASFGLPALRAALSPAPTDYLFFVATGDGGHRFASSLRDHGSNVHIYRQFQRDERRREREARVPAPSRTTP